MADPIICHYDHAPDAAVSASNEVASLPASNMLGGARAVVSRFSVPSTVIDLTFPTAVTARALALAGLGDSGFSGLSTFTVAASNVALGGTDVLSWDLASDTGGVDPLLRQALADFRADIAARFWRVSVTATGSSLLEIGRLYLGEALSLNEAPAYPLARPFEQRGLEYRTYSGDQLIYGRAGLRRVQINFGPVNDAADVLTEVERKVERFAGTGRQVLWVEDPEDNLRGVNSMILGTIEEVGATTYQSIHELTKRITITEAGAP